MKKKDISLALMTLGLWIDRMEKGGMPDEKLLPFKHSYLRINWWINKNPKFTPNKVLPKEVWQEILEKGHSISPSFLLCHNALSDNPGQPCNTLSSSCHCMESLMCAPAEDFSGDVS